MAPYLPRPASHLRSGVLQLFDVVCHWPVLPVHALVRTLGWLLVCGCVGAWRLNAGVHGSHPLQLPMCRRAARTLLGPTSWARPRSRPSSNATYRGTLSLPACPRSSMRWGVFLFFAGWNLFMTAFAWWLLPETKGVRAGAPAAAQPRGRAWCRDSPLPDPPPPHRLPRAATLSTPHARACPPPQARRWTALCLQRAPNDAPNANQLDGPSPSPPPSLPPGVPLEDTAYQCLFARHPVWKRVMGKQGVAALEREASGEWGGGMREGDEGGREGRSGEGQEGGRGKRGGPGYVCLLNHNCRAVPALRLRTPADHNWAPHIPRCCCVPPAGLPPECVAAGAGAKGRPARHGTAVRGPLAPP